MTLQDIMNEDTISRSHLIGVIKQHHDMMTPFQKHRLSTTEYEQQIIDIVKKEPRTEELTSASDEPVLIDKTSLMNNIESFIINNTDSRPVDVIKIVDNHPVASVDLTQVAMNIVNYLIEEKEVECVSVKEILQAMLSPDIQDDDNKTKDNIDNNANCQHQAN